MRASLRLHALIVLGRFERLRVFTTRVAAEDYRLVQIRRLGSFPDMQQAWKDAELVTFTRVPKFRRKKNDAQTLRQ